MNVPFSGGNRKEVSSVMTDIKATRDIDAAIPTDELYLSDTIRYLVSIKDGIHDRSEIPVRDRIYNRVFQENPDDFTAVKYAKGFKAFLTEKQIHIEERDLLAGFTYRYTYQTTMPLIGPLDYDPLYRPPMDLDQKQEKAAVLAYHGLSEDSKEAEELQFFLDGVDAWLYKHWFSGHILPGHERVLHMGYPEMLRHAKECMEKNEGIHKEYSRSMVIACEAALVYIGRYAALAKKLADETKDPLCKKNLTRLAEACDWLTKGAPRDFYEAIQLLWFDQEMLMAENVPASESLGRMDVYLYPYYEKDKAEGKLTYNEASELLDALWIKFSGNLHSYQAITLSGMGRDGKLVDNDLTYLCMQSTRKLKFDQPLLDFRYTDNMPKKLWNELVALILTGTGFPGIFYDPICIGAKLRAGLSEEDAKDYAIIGCVETGIPGREYTPTELVHLNWPKMFELMLNHGKDQMGPCTFPLQEDKDLDSIQSFEEFYEWYKREMVHYTDLSIRCIELIETTIPHAWPTPFLSLLMEGCVEKGMDVTGGATKYNNTGVSTCGLATAVDSLSAIKKVVFEDRLVTLSQLRDALNANFEGYEELQNVLLNHCPKFGNDDDEADAMMAELIALYSHTMEAHTTPRGGKYLMGLYSVEDHAKAGMQTAATPDGRKAGSFESNSMASVQGKDVNGPTALINSVVKTDLSAATNGMVLDLKFSPSFFENPRHVDALRALIDTYFHDGGMEIQFSVVSRETLLAAQREPEKYRNLVVRVSGFSAYFRSLNKTTQDEIIARTEYDRI